MTCRPVLQWSKRQVIVRIGWRSLGGTSRTDCSAAVKENVQEKPSPALQKAETKKRASLASQEISNYLSTKPHLKQFMSLSKMYLRRVRGNPHSLYLLDKDIADDIARTVSLDLGDDEKNCLVEFDPGPGVLSRCFLENYIDRLCQLQVDRLFAVDMKRIQLDFRPRVQLLPVDLLHVPKLHFQDKLDDGNRVQEVIQKIQSAVPTQNKDPKIIFIGSVPSTYFPHYMITSIVNQTGLLTMNNVQFYFIMHPRTYIHLSCGPEAGYLQYRGFTVMAQLLFNIDFLLKVPREAFFPWESSHHATKKWSKMAKVLSVDPESLYLVKMTPKPNLFTEVVPQAQLLQLWFFIRHHLVSRSAAVIPQLEMWIPGCGPRLIMQNYSIYTQFGSLAPTELLDLFRQFVSWPGFSSSPFVSAAEKGMSKLETSEMDLEEEAKSFVPEKPVQKEH